MRLRFDEAEETFRADVVDFLRARPLDPLQYYRGRGGDTRRLYEELGDRGWLSLSWPVEHGGAGMPLTYEYLLWDTLAYFRAARPDLGPGIVAHTLHRHGTAEQKARFLPDLRSGRACFALGYSEPDAGSDLASLRTRAEREGDHYRVRGTKCWTSDAHHADYLWLLCRTGATDARGRGLTLLVVDMATDGITVAPIETNDGHRLNEVFLDDVVVDVEQRVGRENEAWTIIGEALAVERHIQLLPGRLRRDFEDLVDLLERVGATPVDALDLLHARVRQVEASSLATVAALMAGRSGEEEAARTKLLGTALAQEIPRLAIDLAGPAALAASEPMAFLWQQSVMETIAGGSTEIMLSILARRSLRLEARR